MPLWKRANRYLGEFRRFVMLLLSQCVVDQCTQTAAALTYTTLLALVPLLAIGLMVFEHMPVFPEMLAQVQAFVMDVFSPRFSINIEQYLLAFANKAAGLANLSVIIFFFTAMLTLNTIDHTFNRIWHVRRERSWLLTVIIYIGILLLAPIFIGISLAITTYIVSLPYISDAMVQTGLQKSLVALLPYLVTTGLFSLLYKLVPNVYVAWRHAVAGGLVAAVLFESAKQTFALYLTWFPTYELIYGSIAVFPLLLIWIYVSWLMVLLGAEISYVLGTEKSENEQSGLGMLIAVEVLDKLKQSEKGLTSRQLQRVGGWNGVALLSVLRQLRQHGVIIRKSWGRWELLQDLQRLNLYDLYRLTGAVLPPPEAEWKNKNVVTQRLASALKPVTQELNRLRTVSVASLLA